MQAFISRSAAYKQVTLMLKRLIESSSSAVATAPDKTTEPGQQLSPQDAVNKVLSDKPPAPQQIVLTSDLLIFSRCLMPH